MTLALVVVTLASLAMAAVLLVLVWRLLREERRRSAARVAALEAGIRGVTAADIGSEAPVLTPISPAPMSASRPATAAPVAAADAGAPRRVTVGDDPLSRPLDSGLSDRPAARLVPPHADLFGTSGRPARASRNLGLIAAIGVLIVGTAVSLAVLSSRTETRPALAAADRHAATTVATTSASPLELLSLRHRRDGEALSITGVVRNPVNGGRVQNLTAVVFLFDRDGGFLASGRAPIDYTTLVPGDESPFVVTVKEPGAVGRYRVSFRTDDKVMPHIDRREDIAVARSVS